MVKEELQRYDFSVCKFYEVDRLHPKVSGIAVINLLMDTFRIEQMNHESSMFFGGMLYIPSMVKEELQIYDFSVCKFYEVDRLHPKLSGIAEYQPPYDHI